MLNYEVSCIDFLFYYISGDLAFWFKVVKKGFIVKETELGDDGDLLSELS